MFNDPTYPLPLRSRHRIISGNGIPVTRSRTVTNCIDASQKGLAKDLKRRRDRCEQLPLRLVHTGSLYGGIRNPEPLIKAAARAEEKLQRPIILEFAGNDSYIAADIAADLGLDKLVKAHGLLNKTNCQALVEKADALVALLHDDPMARLSIMSKFFDYAATGIPMMIIGDREAHLSHIVQEQKLGKTIEYQQIGKMVDWIMELSVKPVGGVANNRKIYEFWSPEKMALQMRDVLEELKLPADINTSVS